MNRQIRILGLALILLFAVLFLQLNNLQVLQASKLASAPGNLRTNVARFSSPRGDIQTAGGVVVAKSIPSKDIYKYQRVYPKGPLFADVTGFFSLFYGSDGVERMYNSDLEGHNLPLRDLGDLLTSRTVTENLTLTLSNRLQQVAANALGSQTGAVVALNPANGSVLAMYSNPSYDPNPLASHNPQVATAAWKAYQADPKQPMLARAYRRSYAPGSTFKIVTSSAVFDHDPSLATVTFPSVSQIALPNTTHLLHNYQGRAAVARFPELLTVSCDTGFAQIGLKLGASNLATEAQAFGFNQTPPLDLPDVASSFFPPASAFAQNLPEVAFSAIGQQNVTATALQMALVGSAIANHGVIMVPHVMSQIRDNQGRLVRAWKPKTWLTATSPQTAATMTTLMEMVVQSGTAVGVALPGVQVAAKTGTAQTNHTQGDNNWMVAFAPANAPKVAVAVVVPAQPGLPAGAQGATVAGPIVKAVLSAALSGS